MERLAAKRGIDLSLFRLRHCEEPLRRSNPVFLVAPGLLRCARNDDHHHLSPGSAVPVTRAYIRATEASSSRPMPEAEIIRNICSAAAETGTGNFAVRAMSWMMPRSFTKISTALRGA